MAAKSPTPSQTAIRGRIVTMDTAGTVLPDGIVYIAGATIAGVVPAGQSAAGGVRARPAALHQRHRLPRPDRAAQPPELQLPAAVAGAAAVRQPRPVVDRPRLPPPHQRPDAGDRQDAEPRPGAGALCRGQVPGRRRHDKPGHRALQRRRHPPVLPGRRAERGGARRPIAAARPEPHSRRRRGRRRPGLQASWRATTASSCTWRRASTTPPGATSRRCSSRTGHGRSRTT